VKLRLLAAAATVVLTATPVFAATPAPVPTAALAASYTCYGAPAKASYDKRRDRFIVRYAAERLVMPRAALPNAPQRYVNRKKNVEWRIDGGRATFSSLLPGSDTVDKKLATCVYKR
jgi:hypothetical protein